MTPRPDTVTAGDTISYTLTVSNAGPDAATNVNLNDTLPPNTTFVSLTPNNAAAAAASASPCFSPASVAS